MEKVTQQQIESLLDEHSEALAGLVAKIHEKKMTCDRHSSIDSIVRQELAAAPGWYEVPEPVVVAIVAHCQPVVLLSARATAERRQDLADLLFAGKISPVEYMDALPSAILPKGRCTEILDRFRSDS